MIGYAVLLVMRAMNLFVGARPRSSVRVAVEIVITGSTPPGPVITASDTATGIRSGPKL